MFSLELLDNMHQILATEAIQEYTTRVVIVNRTSIPP